jgi:DNA-binding IscR family transcriptional regulator
MANSQFAMAVHVLAMLANNCDERMKSGNLAESVNTNAVVIRRLLCDLHDAGLVVSQTGYSGGSCLTRDPSKIFLTDIFEAVTATEVFALHRNEPDPDCEIGVGLRPVLENLQNEVSESVKETLAGYSLQNVIDKVVGIEKLQEGKD